MEIKNNNLKSRHIFESSKNVLLCDLMQKEVFNRVISFTKDEDVADSVRNVFLDIDNLPAYVLMLHRNEHKT